MRPPSHFLLAPGVSTPYSFFARRRYLQQTRPHCPRRKLLRDQLPHIQLHSGRKHALLNTLGSERESLEKQNRKFRMAGKRRERKNRTFPRKQQ